MALRQVPDGWFFVTLGLFIKIPHQACTVMLANNIGDLPAKFAGCREFASILDMGDDYQRTHPGGKLIVPVFSLALVLDEIERFFNFADIMVIGADLTENGIGANGLRCSFNHRTDDYGMMITARRFDDHSLKYRLIEVGELQEPDVGRKSE